MENVALSLTNMIYGPPSTWLVYLAVYFLFSFRVELISCSRNPESELKKKSESELACAHEPEHGTQFRFRV